MVELTKIAYKQGVEKYTNGLIGSSKLILFDLDLFEPTEFAWLHLRKSLNRGDIVYFDEGFDIDERKVIEDYVLQDFQVTVIGITNTAIAFLLNERAH